ncbi:MAG: hypothetical protein AAFX93_12875 [Verrucomicrobiota bacterium]
MKTVKNHTVNVSISLPKKLRDGAKIAARCEHRTVSGLVAFLLEHHLSDNGYIPANKRTTSLSR